MRIQLTKISGDRHRLTIIRGDRSTESIELVTREALFHDLLHHAVETALGTQGGFWGTLAGGKSFADLNDRSGESTRENQAILYQVEGIVGVMSGVTDLPVDQAYRRLCWFSETQNSEPPAWCTERFVGDVVERMRRSLGRWKATPYGESMEITWQERGQPANLSIERHC